MKVKYLCDDHPILEKDKVYEVHKKVNGGYLLIIKTGFAGVSYDEVQILN